MLNMKLLLQLLKPWVPIMRGTKLELQDHQR